MKNTDITKVMGRNRETDVAHVFTVALPETFAECISEYGQERADHLWRGALLIEARSAFVGLITEKKGADAMAPAAAIKKMANWKPKQTVGAKGDPVAGLLKKAEKMTPAQIEELKAWAAKQ
jgi:uncharacterized protein YehS (DUF1456 family)